MSKTIRLCVLAVALTSLLGAGASGAGAITWHNSGATSFSGTGTGATLTVTGTSVSCPSATATGTAPALTVGALYRASGTLSLSGCTLAGNSGSADCAYTMTGTFQDGIGMGSTITGLTHVLCKTYVSGSPLCQIDGTVTGTYLNNVPGVLTQNTGGNLVIRNAPTANCPLGNGDLLHLTPRVITTTSTTPPTITRTA